MVYQVGLLCCGLTEKHVKNSVTMGRYLLLDNGVRSFLAFKHDFFNMTFLHHPAFQSLALPLLLGLSLGLLFRTVGARWLVLAPSLALVLALAAWPGFVWPALAQSQVLPWLALGGAIVAAAALILRAPGTTPWRGRTGLWTSSLLALAGLALAAWGALGGSMLLAQLAAMLAMVSAVAAWQAWRHRSGSWAGLLPLFLFAIGLTLCLAWLPASGPAGPDNEDPYYQPG